ncbi:MAG: aminodeoxychorismate lyase, protein [Candidatus Taylorbacteria bacterium]|nr:aminodeoxychorismate lyase, protein [Candidatus Taylorbacteria bacterium]
MKNKIILRRFAYACIVIVAVAAIISTVHRIGTREPKPRTIIVTVIPGSTINSIAKLLSGSGLPSRDFLKLSLPTFDASTSKSAAGFGLEGYLYPDTYNFTSGESAEQIIRTMTENFDAHFPQDLFDHQKGTVRSKRDIVIMASILEKEVATAEDKRIVAGILWKRLEHRLPLQVDSTTHYFLAPSAGLVYNTYQSAGLPFGPISEPSSESIRAALEPTVTDYWYFLSDRKGKIFYSRTLSEHLINKAKYVE